METLLASLRVRACELGPSDEIAVSGRHRRGADRGLERRPLAGPVAENGHARERAQQL